MFIFYNWWRERIYLLPNIMINFENRQIELAWLWFEIDIHR